MTQDTFLVLPYRNIAIITIRLLKPYATSLFGRGLSVLEEVAANIVEALFHARSMSRQYWRKRTVADTSLSAIKHALANVDLFPGAAANIEIILADVITIIDDTIAMYVPYNTWHVFTIGRYYDELVLSDEGDYRILKFHMENPEWKPTKLEEPEEVVLHSRSS